MPMNNEEKYLVNEMNKAWHWRNLIALVLLFLLGGLFSMGIDNNISGFSLFFFWVLALPLVVGILVLLFGNTKPELRN